MRRPRPLQVPTHACVSPLARWRESQLEMGMVQARYRSIFLFAVRYLRLGATNRAPAAAEKNTRTAADGLRKSWGAVAPNPSFRVKLRNGASGTSDMDGNAARVAARESGDEQVQSPSVSEISRDVSSLRPAGLRLGRRVRSK